MSEVVLMDVPGRRGGAHAQPPRPAQRLDPRAADPLLRPARRVRGARRRARDRGHGRRPGLLRRAPTCKVLATLAGAGNGDREVPTASPVAPRPPRRASRPPSAQHPQAGDRGHQRGVRRDRPRAGHHVRRAARRRRGEVHHRLCPSWARGRARHRLDAAAPGRARRARWTCCSPAACCSAHEAAQLGLVNRAVDGDAVLEETLAYARELARECSPASMAAMKRQVYADLERSLRDSVDEANRLMGESFAKPDFAEGVQSFLERRPPAVRRPELSPCTRRRATSRRSRPVWTPATPGPAHTCSASTAPSGG